MFGGIGFVETYQVTHIKYENVSRAAGPPSGEVFSKQLLDIGNSKISVDIPQNCINHDWLSKHAALAAKNIDVKDLNFKIQSEMAAESLPYKSIDSVIMMLTIQQDF